MTTGHPQSQQNTSDDLPHKANSSSRAAGLDFCVADRLELVLSSWELVHDAYVRTGLIDANLQQIHTVPQAVGGHTTVVCGCLRDQVVSTLTMIQDSDRGLPLERVYTEEFAALRGEGRRLMEIGLFADRREQMTRSLPAVLEMMRYVYHRSRFSEHYDLVVGVHPHHAGFYERYFGFELRGRETVHPTVKDHPVVMLWLDLKARLTTSPLPKGLAQYATQPLAPEVFDHRFIFDSAAVNHPRIKDFFASSAAKARSIAPPTQPGHGAAA